MKKSLLIFAIFLLASILRSCAPESIDGDPFRPIGACYHNNYNIGEDYVAFCFELISGGTREYVEQDCFRISGVVYDECPSDVVFDCGKERVNGFDRKFYLYGDDKEYLCDRLPFF
jgi:hypothetical protein